MAEDESGGGSQVIEAVQASSTRPESAITMGEGMDQLSEDDLVTLAVYMFLQRRDPENTGFVDANDFYLDMQSQELGIFLTPEEIQAVLTAHPPEEDNRVNYTTISPLMRNYCMQLYAGREPHPSHWVYIDSQQAGLWWFNKMTGVVQYNTPPDVIVAVQTYDQAAQGAQVVTDEAAQERIAELEQQVQQLQSDDSAVSELQAEAEQLKEQLKKTESERDAARTSQSEEQRDMSAVIEERDELAHKLEKAESDHTQLVTSMRQQLKQTEAQLQERQDTIAALQNQVQDLEAQRNNLAMELKREKRKSSDMSSAAHQAEELETERQRLIAQMQDLRRASEDKARALATARGQLKDAWEKSQQADKEAANVHKLREQLHEEREAHRSTKAMLSSKSKLLAEKTSENTELKNRVQKLEEQDDKRTQVLEELLDRTTRLQLEAEAGRPVGDLSFLKDALDRPFSASPTPVPALKVPRSRQPGGLPEDDLLGDVNASSSMQLQQALARAAKHGRKAKAGPGASRPGGTVTGKRRGSRRSSGGTVSFPPLIEQKMPHQPPISEEEDIAACHIKVGDRVLIKGPKIDGLVKQYTGMVKFVGRVDKETPDFRLHVGLKMDDAVGDSDGLFKGKRYFKCPPNHGLLVPISHVISVISSKVRRSSSTMGDRKTSTSSLDRSHSDMLQTTQVL